MFNSQLLLCDNNVNFWAAVKERREDLSREMLIRRFAAEERGD
jgi:hypothetical protein